MNADRVTDQILARDKSILRTSPSIKGDLILDQLVPAVDKRPNLSADKRIRLATRVEVAGADFVKAAVGIASDGFAIAAAGVARGDGAGELLEIELVRVVGLDVGDWTHAAAEIAEENAVGALIAVEGLFAHGIRTCL